MRIPDPGDVLGEKYRLDELIGEGGSALVYRATDLTVGRSVALKLLRPDGGKYDPSHASRFAREARAVASLEDEHTLRMFDFGRDGELLFMVFEFLDGENLGDVLERMGTLDEVRAERVLRQVLSSLREAHSRGIVHRDVKPDNILVFRHLDDHLRVKLIDFGIARAVGPAADSITKTGAIVGTPRYMAPEQLLGEVSTASDVYSLGLVIFEVLTGETRSVREALAAGRKVALPTRGPLGAVLGKMLRGDPADRYADAGTVLAALDAPSPPVNRDTRKSKAPAARSPRGSSRAWLSPAAVILGVALVCSAAFLVLNRRAVQPRSTNKDAMRRALQPSSPTASRVESDVAFAAPASPSAPDAADGNACGDAQIRLGQHSHRAATEKWLTYVPSSYVVGERHPVLIAYHADGSSPGALLELTGLREFADAHRVVIIAFGTTDFAVWRDGADPFAAQEVLEEVSRTTCIDDSRVFVLGHGSGGGAAESLACEPWVSAVATTSYRSMTPKLLCEPGSRAAMLHIAPLKSKHLPVEGGPTCVKIESVLSLEKNEEMWRDRNGCSGRRSRTKRALGSTCYSWNCDVPFESCHIDGGHGWPGAPARAVDFLKCDGPSPSFDYLGTIWDFFSSMPAR